MSSILAAVSRRWRRFSWRVAGVALVLALGVGGVAGATTTWTNGSGDGKWSTAGNWSAGVPTRPNQAIFNDLGTAQTISAINSTNLDGSVFNGGSYSFAVALFGGNYTVNGGSVTNTALITSGANATITVAAGASFTLSGGISQLNNTYVFAGAGDFYLNSINGGSSNLFNMTGTGNLTLTGTKYAKSMTFSSGKLILGANPALITLSGNSVTFGSAVTTKFQLNGTGRGTTYDALNISGTLAVMNYGGTLALDFGSTFADGDVLDLFKYAGTSGASASSSFAHVEATGLYSGSFTTTDNNTWTLVNGGRIFTFDETTGDLTVAAVPVPEPATCAVIAAGGALGLALWRRRVKRA